MRYHVLIDNAVAAKLDSPEDALAFACMTIRNRPSAVVDVVDTAVGIPFDRAALVAWCQEHTMPPVTP